MQCQGCKVCLADGDFGARRAVLSVLFGGQSVARRRLTASPRRHFRRSPLRRWAHQLHGSTGFDRLVDMPATSPSSASQLLKETTTRVAAVAAFVSMLLACASVPPTPIRPDFDLQAHRGGRDLWPENTLAAFRYSIELGVTTLELDVAVSKDRVVVVSHDYRLNSDFTRNSSGAFISAGERYPIKDLTVAELKTYTVGELRPWSGYSLLLREQDAISEETIPTLAEVFQLAKELGAEHLKFNIEVKTYPNSPERTIGIEEFVQLVLQVIGEFNVAERVTIQSFDWRTLRLVQQKAPQIRIACLTRAAYNLQPGRRGSSPWLDGLDYDEFDSLVSLVKAFGAQVVSPYYRDINRTDVAEAHRQGISIIPWTVNREHQMRRLIGWGVDGIITDRPHVLRGVLSESADQQAP